MPENSPSSNTRTREFFERDPRSALLRNICIRALDASMEVLRSEGEDQKALAELLDVNKQLQEMGIEPEMHTIPFDDPERDVKKQQMASDPVVSMEWIAGQVRDALVNTIGFSNSGSLEALAEHDELEDAGGDVSLVDLQSVGTNTKQFMKDLTLIGAIKRFMDYEAGPSRIE